MTSGFHPNPVLCARLQIAVDSWIGTPFFPHGRIKGEGCSCQTFVGAAYIEAGMLPPSFQIPEGPIDWGRAHKDGLIEPFIEKECHQFFRNESLPRFGDLLGFVVGGCVQHLGICIGEEFVHCIRDRGVCRQRIDDATYLKRLARVWRPIFDYGIWIKANKTAA